LRGHELGQGKDRNLLMNLWRPRVLAGETEAISCEQKKRKNGLNNGIHIKLYHHLSIREDLL
jgi:hypothetical protein